METELSLRQCYDAQKYHESMAQYYDKLCKVANAQAMQKDVDFLVQRLQDLKIGEALAWANDAGHRGQKDNLIRVIAKYESGEIDLDEMETIMNARLLHMY